MKLKEIIVLWIDYSRKRYCKSLIKAIFSGLGAVEIARIIKDYVIPNKKLCGLYHLSADPINKFDLLICWLKCMVIKL